MIIFLFKLNKKKLFISTVTMSDFDQLDQHINPTPSELNLLQLPLRMYSKNDSLMDSKKDSKNDSNNKRIFIVIAIAVALLSLGRILQCRNRSK